MVNFGLERFYFEYERIEFKLVKAGGGRDRLGDRQSDVRKFTLCSMGHWSIGATAQKGVMWGLKCLFWGSSGLTVAL